MSQETIDQARRAPSKPVWVLLAMLAAAWLLYSLMRPDAPPSGERHPAVGSRMPTLTLVPLTGDPPPITAADLKGRVTLINFWGTWCPPCRDELPHLVKLVDEYSVRPDFRAVLISCGEADDPEVEPLRAETEAFLREAKLKLPTYADPNAETRRSLVSFFGGDFPYPTTLILDRQGVIRGAWTGYEPYYTDEMRELVKRLL